MDALPPNAFDVRRVDPDMAESFFAQVDSFERQKYRSVTRQRNALAMLLGVSVFAVGCLAYSNAAVMPLVRFVPLVFTMDKTTGVVDRNTDIDASTLSEATALNRAYAKQYVSTRESYAADRLPEISKGVSLLSSDQENKRFGDFMQNDPQSPVKELGRKGVVGVRVKSITLLSDKKDQAKHGTIQVRFDRVVQEDGAATKSTPWVSTMTFERLKDVPESIRDDNPLAWVVTSYDRRPESDQ
jgi:type IV secretion system protein VirB8